MGQGGVLLRSDLTWKEPFYQRNRSREFIPALTRFSCSYGKLRVPTSWRSRRSERREKALLERLICQTLWQRRSSNVSAIPRIEGVQATPKEDLEETLGLVPGSVSRWSAEQDPRVATEDIA